MTQTLIQADDKNFTAAIARGDQPVLVFFTDPQDETCEFNGLVLDACAQKRGDDLPIIVLDKSANSQTADQFSLPADSIVMLVRNNTILGYKQGRLSQATLEHWIDKTLTKPDEKGVAIDDFLKSVSTKQQRQQESENKSIRAARRNHYIGAAFRVAGGLMLTTAFPVPGFGLAGYAIAGYNAFRAFSTLGDPEQRRPQQPKTLPGKFLEAAVNVVTWAGSFGLLAVAFNATAGGLAFYGTMATALVMLGHSSMGLGRLLPSGLLIGSLRRDADEMSRRDPTKPLDEYSPAAPQPEFEETPEPQQTAQSGFDAAAQGHQTPKQDARKNTKPPAADKPQNPQP